MDRLLLLLVDVSTLSILAAMSVGCIIGCLVFFILAVRATKR